MKEMVTYRLSSRIGAPRSLKKKSKTVLVVGWWVGGLVGGKTQSKYLAVVLARVSVVISNVSDSST
jgi:hypothetical protein